MEYTPKTVNLLLICLSLAVLVTQHVVWGFDEWSPNYVSKQPEIQSSDHLFESDYPGDDSFKLLLADKEKVLIGGKNRAYYLRLKDLKKMSTLEWKASEASGNRCRMTSKTDCTNYIRVIVKKDEDRLYICGTNAYSPLCRHYKITPDNNFVMLRDAEEIGTAICPFDGSSNATALYTDGKMYTATRAKDDGTGPLILQSYRSTKRRTMEGDSTRLNEPQFVSSFEKDDKVYFFFRETAVENINCGKAVFSRVARVCKNDDGGFMKSTFTSFFKARLNCSIPGDFPFYFDEIQSTTEFGQGNYRRTKDSGDRSDMIYGVFNTPGNSVWGSAVCAFTYRDIVRVFQGQFKGQESYRHNWLPVGWEMTPKKHPGECVNSSQELASETFRFAKKHPMMDRAVKPSGGMPMLVFSSFKARFTQIAVDWQLLAADKHYYDVLFVGTDDGRVIKAINKAGAGQDKVESVVIEDIQVLPVGQPVIGLKLISRRSDQASEKLVVVSKDKVMSIPLHRCERATSCRACVALQDPYCAWNTKLNQCNRAEAGIQNIDTGKHSTCEADDLPTVFATEVPEIAKDCSCKDQQVDDPVDKTDNDGEMDGLEPAVLPVSVVKSGGLDDESKREEEIMVAASKIAASSTTEGITLEVLIVAVIASIILSLVIGFGIGYKYQTCRNRDDVFYERGLSSLQRGRNRLSSGDNPHFHTIDHHQHLTPKQTNIVMNRKGNLVETKPVTKSNKVYL